MPLNASEVTKAAFLDLHNLEIGTLPAVSPDFLHKCVLCEAFVKKFASTLADLAELR